MNRNIQRILVVLTVLYLCLFFVSSYAFAFSYPFSHLNDCHLFSFLYITFQIFRFSAFLLVPLAVFYHYKTPTNLVKLLFPVISIVLYFFYGTYTGLSKLNPTLPFYNSNQLSESQIEIYNQINLFLPSAFIKVEYLLETSLLLIISFLLLLQYKVKREDFRSLFFFPLFVLLSLPLNLSENITRLFSKETESFFYFSNFSLWHFLLFFLVIFFTLAGYFLLRKKNKETQEYVLRILCLWMMLLFFEKNSMLVGDGYNIYNQVFASVPLFICDIGKYIVFIAVMGNRKWFSQCAFFVHSAGALTVFFYFGKEGTKNFGTIFSYSFLYFTITHILLFLLSVLPVYLSLVKFCFRSVLSSSCYYGFVLLVAAFVSVLVTNFSLTLKDTLGNPLPSPIYPNYAFTQICPIPLEFPTFLNLKVGSYEINFVYEFTLLISYLALFFTFLGFNELLFFFHGKKKKKEELSCEKTL